MKSFSQELRNQLLLLATLNQEAHKLARALSLPTEQLAPTEEIAVGEAVSEETEDQRKRVECTSKLKENSRLHNELTTS